MKKDLIKMVGGFLLVGVAMLIVLPACGGASTGTTQAPATPQATPRATATSQPTPPSVAAATATPVSAPNQTAFVPPAPTVSAGGGNLLAKGKLVFEKTAGGVGCAYCHSLDAKGKGPSGLPGPDIRPADEARVRYALANVPYMSFIELTDAEITAVAAYLKYLNEQP